MPKLSVRLLGGFRVELDGEAVRDFETDKARALLAYLIVEADRPHRREALATLLWPNRPDSTARTNLRQAIARVRRALSDYAAPFFLFVTPTDIQFNRASDHSLDIAELEAFACSPAHHRQQLPAAFCTDFLDGFAMPDSEVFEEWVLSRQEHYHRLALDTLDAQTAYFEGNGDHAQAATAARLQLQCEPWLEEAHRRCMRNLALAGRRDEAVRQYAACRDSLATELGVEPAASTQALYAEILAEKVVATAPSLTAVRKRTASSPAPPRRLVARESELEQLDRRLHAALDGETQVAFVSGDAGSGKSMLLEAFATMAMDSHPNLLVAGARCNPQGNPEPLELLRKLAGMIWGNLASDVAWPLADGGQMERLQRATGRLLAVLAEHGSGLVETIVPAASLACRAAQALPAGGQQTPAWQVAQPARPLHAGAPCQALLFDQLISAVAAAAQSQPLLLLFDDLQWVDDASAAFILRLGRELSRSRLFVLAAYRMPAFAFGRQDAYAGEVNRHPLAPMINEMRRIQGEIVIDLDRADGRAFVEAYVDIDPNRLGAGFRDALYAQTGGHPLFTVELLRNMRARGQLRQDEAGRWTPHESLDWGPLPARVEGAIAERIEQLPTDCRRILACASVQGDDFCGELAAELAGIPAGEALTCLSGTVARQHHLVRAEGLQRLGSGQFAIYRFTHHLFQKYLYDQLDPVERACLHGAFAVGLDRRVADDPVAREPLSARLAWHFEMAGLPLDAARALLDAGRHAMRVSAYREALNHFEHALALLAKTSPSPERTALERQLAVARIGPERITQGPAGAQLADMWARAAEAGVNEVPGRPCLVLLQAQAERLSVRGQFEAGLAAAEQMLKQAQQLADTAFVAVANWQIGFISNLMGDPRVAEGHFTQVLDALTPERRAELHAAIGTDIATPTLTFSALNQWWLGNSVCAKARSEDAIAGAYAQGDTYGQALAGAIGATVLFLLRDEGARLQECAERCHRVSVQHGYAMWQAYAEALLAYLSVTRPEASPNVENGVAQMQRAIARWQATGVIVGTDALALVLVDGCLAAARRCPAGDDARRDRLLATGLATADQMLEPVQLPWGQSYEAELQRLRGELLLARNGPAAAPMAQACFRNAMALGRAKGALAWELRAAMSLVRLHASQDGMPTAKQAAAQRCLSELYGRYTEGFTFPDLCDAAAMLP